MHPQNPYGEPMPPLATLPPVPEPPRKDGVRTGLIVALVALLVGAAVLAGFLLWPDADKPGKNDAGGGKSTSQQADPSGSSQPPSQSSSSPPPSDQFSSAPGTTAPEKTTNGVSEKQHADACYAVSSGTPDRVSSDPQWGTASGPAVTTLTTLLAYLGYDTAPTASYDAKAEQAAKDFQADHGLEVDGIVGPQTWPIINQAACS